MTRAFQEVILNEQVDLEETGVVVVEEEDQAEDEDAFEAEGEHVDALEDDAPQTTSVEEEKEKTEVLEDSNEKKCRIFSVFLDATAVYRIAFRVSWIPIICQFVNYFVTLALFPGLVTSMESESLGDWFPIILVTVV